MTTTTTDPVYFLLVDDLAENLLALAALLRREGLVLLQARSGRDALELLLKHDVALALVDIQMPGMDGFELAELMRGSERTRRVPIIFLTAGSADMQRRFRGYEAGAVDFLLKPLEPDILRSKAEVFFELYRQRQEVALQRDELKAATEENSRLLKESQQYAAALKEADQRKDEFLAMLAHELRNPLAPVRNAVEILRLTGTTDPTVEKAREIITRQVAHMSRLVDDLLDVARISRGKIQLLTEPCDVAAVVKQTAEDYRPTLLEAGISLTVTMPAEPVIISGDATRLAQVVGNLLHNSRKFTPEGGRVKVAVSTDPATEMVVISVTDTGSGLDAAVVKRLFEPFTQADQALDRSKGGLGLGLALVKGLVSLHAGTVSAESEGPGKGSTFTVRLPLSKSHIKRPNPVSPYTGHSIVDSLRIVVIEDNHDAALSLQLLLSLLGHQVTVANNGRDGIAATIAQRPDVVLSDLGLPGALDGFAVARALREEKSLAGLHLIALSGYGQDEDRRLTSEAGFDVHLVKPVDPKLLEQALAKASRKSPARLP